MFQSLLTLVFGLLIIGAFMWLADKAPFISADAKAVVHYILLIVLVIFAIYAVLGLLGIVAPVRNNFGSGFNYRR